MDSNKICFISCITDDEIHKQQKCIKYLENLFVPKGIELSYLPIKNAPSMTRGYNVSMRSTDAKYKVYLHQDVYILNPNFIVDILTIFKKHPNIGMLGVAGAKTIPASGRWWESKSCFGKVHYNLTGEVELLSFQEPQDNLEIVKVIDGLIIITQYDLPWREDLFKGWHFYDASQSQEFIKAGFQLAVPKQHSPWCLHDHGIVNMNGYDENRKIFLKNYTLS